MWADKETRNRRIVDLMAEILELDNVSDIRQEHRLREDLGMDSLGSMELLSRISEELKLDLDMEDAMAISTVRDACEFVDENYRSLWANVANGQ